MDIIDRPDNRPLARSAIWFLVDSLIVLGVSCLVLVRPDFLPDSFEHPLFLRAGLIVALTLFTLLAVTASVLGFLSNCRSGQSTGIWGIAVLILGWGAIASLILT